MKITAFFPFIIPVLSIYAADFDLGGHGVLSVDVPEKWTVNSEPAAKTDGTQIGYAFAIKPLNDANAKCLLTFAYVNDGKPDQERIRNKVLAACEDFVADSVEKKKNLKDFSLKQGYGAYCVFTDASLVDKKPKSGDYKVMGSGIVQLSDNLLGVVSIFADDVDSKEFKSMIQVINGLIVKAK